MTTELKVGDIVYHDNGNKHDFFNVTVKYKSSGAGRTLNGKNISSVTSVSTGTFDINFSPVFPNALYKVSAGVANSRGNAGVRSCGVQAGSATLPPTTKTTDSVRMINLSNYATWASYVGIIW